MNRKTRFWVSGSALVGTLAVASLAMVVTSVLTESHPNGDLLVDVMNPCSTPIQVRFEGVPPGGSELDPIKTIFEAAVPGNGQHGFELGRADAYRPVFAFATLKLPDGSVLEPHVADAWDHYEVDIPVRACDPPPV